ncbi:hypothetical protein BDFB_010835, partial [Asbolus verrucosus]
TRQRRRIATYTNNEIRVIEVIDNNPQFKSLEKEIMNDEFVSATSHFLKFVMFSDETKFCNNGAVNCHNCHYYALKNLRWIRQMRRIWFYMMLFHQILYEIPDLTLVDCFLWGVLKNKLYETRFQDMNTLKSRIRAACREIIPEILTRIRHSFVTLAQACLQNDGRDFEHLIH